MRLALLALLLVLATPIAVAAEAADPQPIRDVARYLDHQRDLREEMESDRKFKHVDNEAKRRLYAAQDQIFALLDGKKSVDELSRDQLVALYNAQGVVNGVITDAELDREICKREKPVGSHRPVLVCTTVRERRAAQEQTQRGLRTSGRCNPITGTCGDGG